MYKIRKPYFANMKKYSEMLFRIVTKEALNDQV